MFPVPEWRSVAAVRQPWFFRCFQWNEAGQSSYGDELPEPLGTDNWEAPSRWLFAVSSGIDPRIRAHLPTLPADREFIMISPSQATRATLRCCGSISYVFQSTYGQAHCLRRCRFWSSKPSNDYRNARPPCSGCVLSASYSTENSEEPTSNRSPACSVLLTELGGSAAINMALLTELSRGLISPNTAKSRKNSCILDVFGCLRRARSACPTFSDICGAHGVRGLPIRSLAGRPRGRRNAVATPEQH